VALIDSGNTRYRAACCSEILSATWGRSQPAHSGNHGLSQIIKAPPGDAGKLFDSPRGGAKPEVKLSPAQEKSFMSLVARSKLPRPCPTNATSCDLALFVRGGRKLPGAASSDRSHPSARATSSRAERSSPNFERVRLGTTDSVLHEDDSGKFAIAQHPIPGSPVAGSGTPSAGDRRYGAGRRTSERVF